MSFPVIVQLLYLFSPSATTVNPKVLPIEIIALAIALSSASFGRLRIKDRSILVYPQENV